MMFRIPMVLATTIVLTGGVARAASLTTDQASPSLDSELAIQEAVSSTDAYRVLLVAERTRAEDSCQAQVAPADRAVAEVNAYPTTTDEARARAAASRLTPVVADPEQPSTEAASTSDEVRALLVAERSRAEESQTPCLSQAEPLSPDAS